MNRRTLRKIFNGASLPLYMLNEGLQTLHVAGVPVYNLLPGQGGYYARAYMSSFFGAYAAAFGVHLVIQAYKPSLMRYGREIAMASAAAMLTLWEHTHRYGGRFDWTDMGVYAAALAIFYKLNAPPETTPQKEPARNVPGPVL